MKKIVSIFCTIISLSSCSIDISEKNFKNDEPHQEKIELTILNKEQPSISLQIKNNTKKAFFVNLQEINMYIYNDETWNNICDKDELTAEPAFPMYLEIPANSTITEPIDLKKAQTSSDKYRISLSLHDSTAEDSKKILKTIEFER